MFCSTTTFYPEGIFTDTTGAVAQDHDISVVGYGEEENGNKFWLIRNSWGTYWVKLNHFFTVQRKLLAFQGDKGYFRLARGTNNLGIEEGDGCAWVRTRTVRKLMKCKIVKN